MAVVTLNIIFQMFILLVGVYNFYLDTNLLIETASKKVEVHEGEKYFKCHKCNGRFSNKISLDKHLKVAHEHWLLYQCSLCQQKFPSKSEILQHGSIHKI